MTEAAGTSMAGSSAGGTGSAAGAVSGCSSFQIAVVMMKAMPEAISSSITYTGILLMASRPGIPVTP